MGQAQEAQAQPAAACVQMRHCGSLRTHVDGSDVLALALFRCCHYRISASHGEDPTKAICPFLSLCKLSRATPLGQAGAHASQLHETESLTARPFQSMPPSRGP